MSRSAAGITAGTVAGAAMAMGMMAWMAAHGQSVWTNPNLIAVMWLGEVDLAALSRATALGFGTHMVTSALMGWIALPFIDRLPSAHTMLVAVVYALASYPLVFALVLTWANPLMVEQSDLVPMTLAHIVFGLVLGAVYLRLRPTPRYPVSG